MLWSDTGRSANGVLAAKIYTPGTTSQGIDSLQLTYFGAPL